MIRSEDTERRGRAGRMGRHAAAAPGSPVQAPPALRPVELKVKRSLQQLQPQPESSKDQKKQPEKDAATAASVPWGTIGDGVDIRPSHIPAAGNGLFAARFFSRGDLITEYEGCVISHLEAQLLRVQGRHTHVRVLNMQHAYIDGLKAPQLGVGGGSFANDSRDTTTINSVYDTRFDRRMARSRVFLRALRDIAAGEEVFVSYGSDYWKSFEAVAATGRAAATAGKKGSSGGIAGTHASDGARAGLRRAASRSGSSVGAAGSAPKGAARTEHVSVDEALSTAAQAFTDMLARAQARSERAGRRDLVRSGSGTTNSSVGNSFSSSNSTMSNGKEGVAAVPRGTRTKRTAPAAATVAAAAPSKRLRAAPGSQQPAAAAKTQAAAKRKAAAPKQQTVAPRAGSGRSGGTGRCHTGQTDVHEGPARVRVLKPKPLQQGRKSPTIRRIADSVGTDSSASTGSVASGQAVTGAGLRRSVRGLRRASLE